MTLRMPAARDDVARAEPWARPRPPLAERRYVSVLAPLAATVLILAAWEIAAQFVSPVLISSPQQVAAEFVGQFRSGTATSALGISLRELYLGLAIGLAAGIALGMLMGRVRLAEKSLDPLVAFGNATPSIALLPVMEVWFGFGTAARVAFIMVICTWPILVNTYAGVRAVRSLLTDVGKAFGMNGWTQTLRIYLPGTMPYIFVGARIALAVGAVGMILGGQEIGQTGLGGLTQNFGNYSQTDDLVATIVTTTALALLLFAGLRMLQRRAFPWIAATSAGQRRA